MKKLNSLPGGGREILFYIKPALCSVQNLAKCFTLHEMGLSFLHFLVSVGF
jgi:hypothetical protein